MADDGDEVPLLGGRVTSGVVRVGDTVRRPRGDSAAFVEALLVHLEWIGFAGAPRFLGLDERGRQILTYVVGDVPSDTWTAVFPDTRLVSAARLLRAFHDATAGSELAAGAEVVCHGDPGAWNMVWRDNDAVALIDFDAVEPAPRLTDVGYLLWKHLNLGKVALDVREQARRIMVCAAAYGTSATPEDLIASVDNAQARTERKGRVGGWGRGPLRYLSEERRWLAEHASLLAEAMT